MEFSSASGDDSMCECSQAVEEAVLGTRTGPLDDRDRGSAWILLLWPVVVTIITERIIGMMMEEEERKAGGGAAAAAVEGRGLLLAEKTQKGARQGTWMARAEQVDIDAVALCQCR